MGCTGSKHKDGGVEVSKSKRKDRKNSGMVDAGKHDDNYKKQQQQPDNDGIAAFAPSASLAQQYAAYIREVRKAGIENGVMKPVEKPHLKEGRSISANIRRNPPHGDAGLDEVDPNAAPEKNGNGDNLRGAVNGKREQTDNDGKKCVDGNEDDRKGAEAKKELTGSDDNKLGSLEVPALEAHTPPASVTVFQCRPIPSMPVIGKGQYSQVVLASMSVVRGELDQELQLLKPRNATGSTTTLDGPYLSAVNSNAENNHNGTGRRPQGAYGERHFLVAMKEIPVLSSQPQSAILQYVKKQVQCWTRLSAYSPRVLRCLQMECVYGNRSGSHAEEGESAKTQHQPAHGATFHDFGGVSRPSAPSIANNSFTGAAAATTAGDGGATDTGLTGKKGFLGRWRKGEQQKGPSAFDESSAGPVTRIRIYMEFAKYGSLRTFQLREMPEKYNRSRLHELTARAFMREVLLALVDIHEQDCLQYDVCAKSIFLVRPIKSVYRTYFPAYISDLPVGHLLCVPPRCLQEAMQLMNPTLTLSQQQQMAIQQQQLQQSGDAISTSPAALDEANLTPPPQRKQQRQHSIQSPNVSSSFPQNYPNRQGIEAGSPVMSSALNHHAANNLSMIAIPSADIHQDATDAFPGLTSNVHSQNFRNGRESGTSDGAGAGSTQSSPQQRQQRASVAAEHCKSNSNIGQLHQGDEKGATPPEDPLSSDLAFSLSRTVSYLPHDLNAASTAAGRDANFVTTNSVVYNDLLIKEQKWIKDDYREYMEENGYEDCLSLPVPSPHDGFLDYNLASAVAKLTVKEELEPQQECMQVYPLRDAKDGGLAIICHDRYGTLHHRRVPTPDEQPQLASNSNSNSNSNSGAGGGPLSGEPGGSAGCVVEIDSLSFAPAQFEATTAAPPQVLPSSADPSGYVLPSSVTCGAGGVVVAPLVTPNSSGVAQRFASPLATDSLRNDVASNQSSRGRGTTAHGLRPSFHHSTPSTSAAAAATLSSDSFRGALVRLNHVAAIRRGLAMTNTCARASSVPVHRFVTVTHAAPEVLQRKEFTQASDIFAFAMTFIELVTEGGELMGECVPENLPKPRTRKEKEEYDSAFASNINKWYNTRIDALSAHREAAEEEQQLPESVQPPRPPIVVRLPEHLSDECKNMLKWCLQTEPEKRPSAVELLSSKYFLFGDWIAGDGHDKVYSGGVGNARSSSGKNGGSEKETVRLPEKPWRERGEKEAAPPNNELLAQAAGFPVIPDRLIARGFSPKMRNLTTSGNRNHNVYRDAQQPQYGSALRRA